MKNLRTPESLAALPNARLMRRHDAIRSLYHRTPSANMATRCLCRLSVIRSAASLQTSNAVLIR